MVVVGGGNLRGNLGCNWTRIHAEIQGKFLNHGWNEMEVSPNLETFWFTKKWHQKNTGIFLHNWDPSYVIKFHFEILREARGKFPRWNIPRDSTLRRRKYPHRKFPLISPEFPEGNYEEIPAGMIPRNSPLHLRGNLGDVDGSPTGTLLSAYSVECRTVYSLYTLIQHTCRPTLI